MYCIECATDLPENAKFCHSCAAPQQQGRSVAVAIAEPVVLPPATMAKASQKEMVFLDQRGGTTVTNTRFIVPGKTYAMAGITSVGFEQIEAKRGWPLIFCVVGGLCLFSPEARIFGFIILVIGGLWLYGTADEYSVTLHTAAGEVRPIISKNRKYIEEIVNALDEAIIYRR